MKEKNNSKKKSTAYNQKLMELIKKTAEKSNLKVPVNS